MNEILPMSQAVADDRLARRIERLQLAYVHSLDDGALDAWPQFFTERCLYRIVGRDNFEEGSDIGVMRFESRAMLTDRATATKHAAVYAPRLLRHILSGTVIEKIGPDGIRTRTNVAIYQTSADGDTLLLMVAQYRDLIVEQAGELKFKEKQVVYDTLRLPDSVVYPL
jgi:3-phenylpropionate/cinnamic acid dioxygenase small subunit